MEKDEFKELLKEIVGEMNHPADECYPEEHKQFVSRWIKKEERRQELWESVRARVYGTGVIAALTYIGLLIWDAIHSPHN